MRRAFAAPRLLVGLCLAVRTTGLERVAAPRMLRARALKRVAGGIAAAALATTFTPVAPAAATPPSNAATSAGSRVNKDPESLLRNGLPVQGKIGSATKKLDVRALQSAVESIKDDLRAKRINAAKSDVQKAATILNAKGAAIAAAAPPGRGPEVAKLLEGVGAELGKLPAILADTGPAGSPQERDSLDRAGEAQARAARAVGAAEARLVPPSYRASAAVPAEFAGAPLLDGRARVEFTLRKAAKGDTFNVDGTPYARARLEMVLDGYTAPATSGNFLDLVKRGFYDGMAIQRSDGFVVQTGDPDGPDGPLVGFGQDGDPKKSPRRVPLEIFVDGDARPTYSETTEEGQRGAAQTVLPFQAYGALGMARDEYEADSASSQWFWLLFDSDLTPAGKNLLDGRYACFGYTVVGEDFLGAVQEGDVIESARILAAPPPFGSASGVDP